MEYVAWWSHSIGSELQYNKRLIVCPISDARICVGLDARIRVSPGRSSDLVVLPCWDVSGLLSTTHRTRAACLVEHRGLRTASYRLLGLIWLTRNILLTWSASILLHLKHSHLRQLCPMHKDASSPFSDPCSSWLPFLAHNLMAVPMLRSTWTLQSPDACAVKCWIAESSKRVPQLCMWPFLISVIWFH